MCQMAEVFTTRSLAWRHSDIGCQDHDQTVYDPPAKPDVADAELPSLMLPNKLLCLGFRSNKTWLPDLHCSPSPHNLLHNTTATPKSKTEYPIVTALGRSLCS